MASEHKKSNSFLFINRNYTELISRNESILPSASLVLLSNILQSTSPTEIFALTIASLEFMIENPNVLLMIDSQESWMSLLAANYSSFECYKSFNRNFKKVGINQLYLLENEDPIEREDSFREVNTEMRSEAQAFQLAKTRVTKKLSDHPVYWRKDKISRPEVVGEQQAVIQTREAERDAILKKLKSKLLNEC